MRRREFYWSLYHREEKNQLDDLRTDQLEVIFAAIPKSHRGQYLIWRDGFKNWKSFEDFPLLLQDLRTSSDAEALPPPPPSKRIEDLDREVEAAIERTLRLALSEEETTDNRKVGRYDSKLRLRIHHETKTFETMTANMSMEGMLLQHPLPTWLPKYFTIELYKDDVMIRILCSRIGSRDGKPSNRVRIESNDNCEVLRSWMVSSAYPS